MNISTTDAEVQEHLRSLTALYVEDVAIMRVIGNELLSRFVGNLISAENGAEGLKAFREHRPDIIITDIQMPIMDGLTMLREIRSIDNDKLVPAVILSGLEEVELLKRSIDLDTYRYVIKPLEPVTFSETLLECARRLLVEKKLREAHDFVETIVENVRPPLMVLNSELKILFANAGFYETLKLLSEETIGNSIYDLGNRQWNIPELRQLFNDILDNNISFIDFELEGDFCRIGHKVFLLSARQIIWESAASNIILLSLEDITQRKQAETRINQALAAAESASKAKSEFLSNMSHEIRTPMHGLLGMAQLLEMTGLTEEQQEFMTALKLSGDNLMSLINDILDLSKIEAGKVTIETMEFSLRCAIDEVYMMQKSAIFFKNLAFKVTIDEQIPHLVLGDQLRLKQIIHNLLGNAAKFTKQGGIIIAARIHERYFDSCIIEISVTDTGIGISAEALEKIFNPFVQEDGSTTRQFGGTGLGLTICRRLTELMGGSISVESCQGVGSTFKLILPFTIPTVLHTPEIKEHLTASLWDTPPLRILLAEDNPVNQIYCRVLLGRDGHEIMTAENGEECLEAVDRLQFDLILMDIQMPVMNGREALRAIRTKEEGTSRHQRVIALTAHALHGEKENFLAEGFDGYLSKPMVQEELIVEMKRVMNLTFGIN